MKRCIISSLFCVVIAAFLPCEALHAQGTAFMYQGRLNDGGNPAGGIYDLRFTIYDSTNIPGTVIAGPLTNSATAVSNGLFTVTLDYGPGVFTGLDRWLDIGVRTNGSINAFTVLVPRQHLTPVPYAIFANTASNLSGSLPAAQLAGTLPASVFAGYTDTVALTNNGNVFSGTFNGTFIGNGGGVFNVNVANLTGVLADSQLPSNTAFVNSNQTFIGSNTFTGNNSFKGANTFAGTNTFTGVNTFTNLGNSFSGSFFGNGLVGWIVVSGTSTQAMSDAGYLLTNAQLTTVTLPPSPTAGDIVRISGAGAGGWRVAQNTNQSILGNFSSFGGSQWRLTSALISQNWDSIASSANGNNLAATIFGSGGGIYLSSDSGQTWVATNTTFAGLRAIASSLDGSKLVAANYGGGLYTNSSSASGGWGIGGSTSGLNWISVASSSDGSKLVAAANGNGIYTSTNSGATWNQQTTGLPSGTPNWYYVASSANGSNLVAVIHGGGLYTSANAGQSWAQQTTGLPVNPNWISVASSADGSKLAAVAVGGGIYTSANLGSNWAQQTNGAPATTNWASIASSSDGSKLAAVVYGGGIYLSSNSGLTWAQVNAPSNNWYCVALSADGSKLATVVYGGGIYTSVASLAATTSTTGTNGYITGPQGSSVELQYIGNGQFMPVSSAGNIWAF
ncbi:MAG: hypothetical protein ABSC01_10300 [Verrucomicrobiota bacterium]